MFFEHGSAGKTEGQSPVPWGLLTRLASIERRQNLVCPNRPVPCARRSLPHRRSRLAKWVRYPLSTNRRWRSTQSSHPHAGGEVRLSEQAECPHSCIPGETTSAASYTSPEPARPLSRFARSLSAS